MSLLEDVFLEDEAGEAQELERIIEGDEIDERPRSAASNSDDDSEKEDEATEDKRRVDPTKEKTTRVVKNPRVILNPARLTGPRGIQVIPDHFKDFKFKGKGHEKDDLDLVLKKLEHWAYRLFPKFEFGDCLKKIETLGKKRPVMVHLHKIRSDQYITEETVIQRDSSDDEQPAPDQPPEEDEFDKLLQQQIEIARATPAPGSVTKRGFETPSVDKRSPFTMPKATSSPSISDEQRDRMIRNRQLAEERRLSRLKQNTSTNTNSPTVDLTNNSNDVEVNAVKKHNRSNVIDSSDDEDSDAVNQPVIVDIQMHATDVKDVTEVNDESASTSTKDRQEFDGNKTGKTQNKSNVIDSSDDEDSDAVNQPVIVDIQMHATDVKDVTEVNDESASKSAKDRQEFDSNKTGKKQNKSNVIDSSDDEDSNTVNQTVTVDIQMHESAVIDVTEVNDESASKSVKDRQEVKGNKIDKKQNKSDVTDSSNDEGSNTANKPVTVDVQARDTAVKDMIEINDEFTDTAIIDEVNGKSTQDKNITVDLTEGIPIKQSSVFKEGQVIDIGDEDYKSNVAEEDSSDEECEMTSFNQSVSVDVHSKHIESTNNIERATSNIGKRKNVDSVDKDNETEIVNDYFEEIQNKIPEENNQIDDTEVTSKQITEMANFGEQNDKNSSEIVTNEKDIRNLSSGMLKDNKENDSKNTIDPVEELMDVDFSDDF